jgi:aromatic ring hydroxylase
MVDCKTGAEHLAALRDGREVYIEGERVLDVTIPNSPASSSARSARRR